GVFAEPGPAAVLGRRDQHSVVEQGDGVLDVYRDRTVPGHHGPPVGELHRVRRTLGDHRFDRQGQARDQPGTLARPAVVENVRVLVHLGTDAVPAVPAHDPVPAGGPDGRLDRGGDVGQPAPPACGTPGRGVQPGPHRVLGYLDHPGQLRPDLA